MAKTPKEIAEKWARRASAAAPDYVAGIDRVTESPTEKAAAKKDKFLANLMKSIQDGKWEKGLKAVSLSEWKDKAKTKGAANYPVGIRAAESDMEDFMSEVMPHIESGKTIIDKMPDITLEDSKARAVAWIDHMSKFKRSKYK